MSPEIVTEFIEGQISGIVAQIRKPKTGKPEELSELMGELMVWWEEDRKRRPDWSPA